MSKSAILYGMLYAMEPGGRGEKPEGRRGRRDNKPIVLPDGTEVIIVGGVPVRRRRKNAPEGAGKSPEATEETAGERKTKPAAVRRRPQKPEPERPEKPEEPPELTKLFREAESLFIDGDFEKAAAIFRRIVAEHPGTPSARKAAEYLEIVE